MNSHPLETEVRRFSLGSALGWSALILLTFFAGQVFAGTAYAIYYSFNHPDGFSVLSTGSVLVNANFLSLAVIFSGLSAGAVTLLISRTQKLHFQTHLGFQKTSFTALIAFTLVAVGLNLLGMEWFKWVDAKPDETMIELLSSGTKSPLTWIAVVIVAPLFEELFFRGYMFYALRNTQVGVAGAIIIANFIWLGLHMGQYDIYGMIWLFIAGVLFGIARFKTDSLITPIVMHIAFNLVAMISGLFTST